MKTPHSISACVFLLAVLQFALLLGGCNAKDGKPKPRAITVDAIGFGNGAGSSITIPGASGGVTYSTGGSTSPRGLLDDMDWDVSSYGSISNDLNTEIDKGGTTKGAVLLHVNAHGCVTGYVATPGGPPDYAEQLVASVACIAMTKTRTAPCPGPDAWEWGLAPTTKQGYLFIFLSGCATNNGPGHVALQGALKGGRTDGAAILTYRNSIIDDHADKFSMAFYLTCKDNKSIRDAFNAAVFLVPNIQVANWREAVVPCLEGLDAAKDQKICLTEAATLAAIRGALEVP